MKKILIIFLLITSLFSGNIEYFLIMSDTQTNFIRQVNNCLNNGWVLFGAPFSGIYYRGNTYLCQAVIRTNK